MHGLGGMAGHHVTPQRLDAAPPRLRTRITKAVAAEEAPPHFLRGTRDMELVPERRQTNREYEGRWSGRQGVRGQVIRQAGSMRAGHQAGREYEGRWSGRSVGR